jgi:hypothetical protein
LYLYGDPAYHNTYGIIAPYSSIGLTDQQEAFNVAMSRCRIAVENAFGLTANLWAANQFAVGLQSRRSPVAAYYMVAILITNIYICVRAQPSPFGLTPPLLEEYLQLSLFPYSMIEATDN